MSTLYPNTALLIVTLVCVIGVLALLTLALAFVVSIFRSLRFGQAGDEGARCAACHYPLVDACAHCPECGVDLARPRAVFVGIASASRRVRLTMLAGLAIAALLVLMTFALGRQFARGFRVGAGSRSFAVERVGGLTGTELVASALASPPDPPPFTTKHDLYGEIARRMVRSGQPGSPSGINSDLWVRTVAGPVLQSPAFIEALATEATWPTSRREKAFSWTGIPTFSATGVSWSRGGAEELFVAACGLREIQGFDFGPLLAALTQWRVTAIEVGARGDFPPTTLLAVSLDARRQPILAGFHAEEITTRVDGRVVYESAMIDARRDPFEGAFGGMLEDAGLREFDLARRNAEGSAEPGADASAAASTVARTDESATSMSNLASTLARNLARNLEVSFRIHDVGHGGGPREQLVELKNPPITRLKLSPVASPEEALKGIAEALSMAELDPSARTINVWNGPAKSVIRNSLSIQDAVGAQARLSVEWGGATFDLGSGVIVENPQQSVPRVRQWVMPMALRTPVNANAPNGFENPSDEAVLTITFAPMSNEALVAWLVRGAADDGRIPHKEYLDREVSIRVPLRASTKAGGP